MQPQNKTMYDALSDSSNETDNNIFPHPINPYKKKYTHTQANQPTLTLYYYF